MENFNDLFNLDANDFIEKNEKRESELYKPDPKNGKDNVYKALIRFIVFFKDPKKSKVKKYSYWLTDPLTGDSFSVDCPSSVGQKSTLQDAFWKLKKSQSVAEQKLSEKFKRRENYYALIQIVKDENDPSNVGKIKVFKFGQKLNKVLQDELQPEYGTPYNPFDPLKGRLMSLTVTVQGGFNNYDLSKFVGEAAPLMIDGTPIQATQVDMNRLSEHLKANSPDLSKYDFQEWTDEVREKVKSVIDNTVPMMRTTEGLKNEMAKPQNISIDSAPKSGDGRTAEIEDLNLDTDSTDDFDKDLYAGL